MVFIIKKQKVVMKNIRIILIFCTIIFLNLFSYKICLIPFEENATVQSFFYKDGLWDLCRQAIDSLGSKLILYSNPNKYDSDIIVSFNLHSSVNYQQYKTNCKKILFLFEPPSVEPNQYNKQNHIIFDKIFTWDDDLVDNVKYFKFYLPLYDRFDPSYFEISFDQKKFCTMICFNKNSGHQNELYSERRKTIEFFENLKTKELDLYGFGWSKHVYKNYKGSIDDKFSVLKQYKFSVCYENIKNIKGYISEKIFHCLLTGCVPIYWGASNVEDYIPKTCFIDRRNFNSNKELYNFLKNVKKPEYQNYRNEIKKFMVTENAYLFSWYNFIELFKTQIF